MTGIAFPSGSSNLYTGSKDETLRVWDCQSGQVACFFFFFALSVCIAKVLFLRWFNCMDWVVRP